jgi:hypothetical protein
MVNLDGPPPPGAVSDATRTCCALALAAAALALNGCSNPDAPGSNGVTAEAPELSSPGEPKAPPPPAPSDYTAAKVKRTPTEALESFAARYVNWSYRDISANQRTLAAMSVGAARTAELQAAAASTSDSTIRTARIANHGSVLSVAREQGHAGVWVIVTHESTSGAGDYEGLPSSYHVTIARLQSVPGGYAVSEWLPQS